MVKVFLSGRPGVGKTTVFMRVVNQLRAYGVRVAGFTCPELRGSKGRLGFDLVDLSTGRRAKLARLMQLTGFSCKVRVGRYCVFDEAGELGYEIIEGALRGSVDIIAIDEVGPMELKIPKLKSAIERALEYSSNVLAVVHRGIAREVARRYGGRLIWITLHNRSVIHNEIIKDFIKNINISKDI